MAVTLATLSGTVADLVGDVVLDGNDNNPNRRVKVYIDSNAPDDYIADLDNNVMRLGTATVTPAADGTFSFADLIATGSADTNLDDSANLQYTVTVDYPQSSPGVGQRRVREAFGPFALTASSDVTDLVAEQALDLSYASEFMTQAQALLDAQVALSGIDDTDSAIAAIVDDPVTLGPLTGAALSAAYARVFGVAAPTGVAATDRAAIQAQIDAAAAAGGGRVSLQEGSYAIPNASDLVIKAGVSLEGQGSGATTIALATSARVATEDFDSLTGTQPTAAPWGPGGFGLHGVTVDGGDGIRFFGFNFSMSDVIQLNSADKGFYSEWTTAELAIPADASMEAKIVNCKFHHNANSGFEFNGPHDSTLLNIHSYFNGAGTGILLGPKANGTQLTHGHSYGVDHAYALEMKGSGQQVVNTQAEGALTAQVRILGSDCQFSGLMYSAQATEATAKGVVIGQSGQTAPRWRVEGIIQNCETGAFDLTYDGGYGAFDVTVYQDAGPLFVGSNEGAANTAGILTPFGVASHGYNRRHFIGNHNFSGEVIFQGNLRGQTFGINGQQSGPRAATADATDLATAITLVNALKADLIAFGLKSS